MCASLFSFCQLNLNISLLTCGTMDFAIYSLALASLGWTVLATDTSLVINKVLSPNVNRHAGSLPGKIHIRELDWTVSADQWNWTHPTSITTPLPPHGTKQAPEAALDRTTRNDTNDNTHLQQAGSPVNKTSPPFDLIIMSDTLYVPELLTPLLDTIYALCTANSNPKGSSLDPTSQGTSSDHSPSSLPPPTVYVGLERRDPAFMESAISLARDKYGFVTTRISGRRLAVAVGKAGVKWEDIWDDVEVWKWVLKPKGETQ